MSHAAKVSWKFHVKVTVIPHLINKKPSEITDSRGGGSNTKKNFIEKSRALVWMFKYLFLSEPYGIS